MVRLRHRLQQTSTLTTAFQFHYGAIKTRYDYAFPEFANLFQFHYGAIKTVGQEERGAEAQRFQFHYGAIKTRPNIIMNLNNKISIPLWCD